MSREADSGGFFTGFFLGALAGAAVALLFSPFSGEEIRAQLRDRGQSLSGRTTALGREARRRAEWLRIRGQALLEEQKLRFQEAIEEGKIAAAQKKQELLAQLEGDSVPPPSEL